MDPIALSMAGAAVAGLYALAYRRKGKVGNVQIGSRRIELHSPGGPKAVFDTIAAIGSPYHLDDADPERKMLVLSSRPSIWSYGFLYPVTVVPEGDGSRIEIGVTSRFFHIGPGMGRAHTCCAQAIERLLTVPPARIV